MILASNRQTGEAVNPLFNYEVAMSRIDQFRHEADRARLVRAIRANRQNRRVRSRRPIDGRRRPAVGCC